MSSSNSQQGDVQTLIEAVKTAKRRQRDYETAKVAHQEAVQRIQDLIGGDGLAAIANGERCIGALLSRIEGETF